MAKFDVIVQGIPFTVDGVDDEEQARSRVLEAAKERPEMLGNKAQSLGMDFDHESQTGRERSELNKFIIGAGKQVQDTIDMVHTAFLEQSGVDFQALVQLDARVKADQESFDQLSGAGASVSAHAGEIAMATAPLVIGGGVTLVRGLFGMARFLSPLRWFKVAGKKFMEQMTKRGVDGRVMEAALKSPKGQNVVKAMQKAEKPSVSTTKQWAETIAKEGGAKPFKVGANKGVRDAQVKIAQGQRAPKTQGPKVSTTETAAQRSTSARATEAAARNRASQTSARKAAVKEAGQTGRQSVKEQAARVRREIAELVRKQSTGQ